MGIFSIIMMIIDLITGIPKIIALIDAIIELLHTLHGDQKAAVIERFRHASEALKVTNDKEKYQTDLESILADMKKSC